MKDLTILRGCVGLSGPSLAAFITATVVPKSDDLAEILILNKQLNQNFLL